MRVIISQPVIRPLCTTFARNKKDLATESKLHLHRTLLSKNELSYIDTELQVCYVILHTMMLILIDYHQSCIGIIVTQDRVES